MTLSRRTLLAGGLGAGLWLARGPSLFAAPTVLASRPGDVFTHGVASGDPDESGVVLWTRVAEARFDTVLGWSVAAAADPTVALASGEVAARGDADGTAQVTVTGLPSGTELVYRFDGPGGTYVAGRTRTLPSDPSQLRIGVVSCSKYADGYYNAYRALADMDVDLVVHLGDYLYASRTGASSDPLGRWAPIPGRHHLPDKECSELADYRGRYRQYRGDPDLQRLHATHPVVTIWDDNDIANNAFRDGNQAGQRGEEWYARKRDGQQAWAEYHPTRVGAPDERGDLQIWRRIRSGDLLDLFLLDTRLQRDEQVSNAAAGSTAANDDPDRTMLGADQFRWLASNLVSDRAAWRVVGQGIVMTHWRVVGGPEQVGQLRRQVDLVHDTEASQAVADGGVYWNSDGWDGYSYERDRLLEVFDASEGDVVVLTGDVHSSWANELVPDADYTNGSVGVEFVAPAASTRPFASNVYGATAPFEAMFTAANPWIKQCDMDANGFCVVTLDEDRAVGEWYQVDAQTPGGDASRFMAWQTMRGTNTLVPYLDL